MPSTLVRLGPMGVRGSLTWHILFSAGIRTGSSYVMPLEPRPTPAQCKARPHQCAFRLRGQCPPARASIFSKMCTPLKARERSLCVMVSEMAAERILS